MQAEKSASLVEAFINRNTSSAISAFLITNFYLALDKEET